MGGESCSTVHQRVTALSLAGVLLEGTGDTGEEKGCKIGFVVEGKQD